MRSIWKLSRLSLLVILACVAAYQGWQIIEARDDTPALITGVLRRAEALQTAKPEHLDILLLVEDPTFWTNDGTDFSTAGQGLTTLTQALAKRLYFERFTPGFRKLELILISKFVLTDLVSKQDILRAFMATAYLGRDNRGAIIGFLEGAQRWNSKDLIDLTDEEFTELVAMLIAPDALNPTRNPEGLNARTDRIARLIAGDCVPEGLLDVYLEGCDSSD